MALRVVTLRHPLEGDSYPVIAEVDRFGVWRNTMIRGRAIFELGFAEAHGLVLAPSVALGSDVTLEQLTQLFPGNAEAKVFAVRLAMGLLPKEPKLKPISLTRF